MDKALQKLILERLFSVSVQQAVHSLKTNPDHRARFDALVAQLDKKYAHKLGGITHETT